ncbi:hypothetical protein vseg_009386 [Gypsophila vaccaria]
MADGQPLKRPPGYMDPNRPAPRPPPAAQRKPVVPQGFYQTNNKKRSCCRICCCCVCCVVLFFVILVAIATALFYTWFQPKVPSFHFKGLELDRFKVEVKRDGTALLDSRAIIRVEAINPNTKLKIHYGETEVSLTLDKEIQLGSTTLPDFVQPPNNMTLLKFNLGVDNVLIDSSTGMKLSTRVKNEDAEINAMVNTKVGIGIGKTKIGMLPVNVNCGGITLQQLNQGGISPKCSFTTLQW